MYATITQMIERFGETDMIRLSEPEDRTAETWNVAKIETALTDASVAADSFLRARYALPVANPPRDLVRHVCILARYDLAQGGNITPSDEMTDGRKDSLAWFKLISDNKINIDAPSLSGTTNASHGAKTSDRPQKFSASDLAAL
ncbi:MAG: hypothetical protein COB78_05715 [Hyphomicrobiales bacterium]|nr:MAG: hypothetical protein COB78_05715 [Hyphomicrobiales bacterium]